MTSTVTSFTDLETEFDDFVGRIGYATMVTVDRGTGPAPACRPAEPAREIHLCRLPCTSGFRARFPADRTARRDAAR